MRPSTRLIALVLALAAATVVVALWFPEASRVTLLVWAGLGALALIDLVLSALSQKLEVSVEAPPQGYVGHTATLRITVSSSRGRLGAAIRVRPDLAPELTLRSDQDFALEPDADHRQAQGALTLSLRRRGRHAVRAIWLQRPTRLKLFDMITRTPLDRDILVIPDVSPVMSGAIRTQMLPMEYGQKDMRIRGEGSEFHQFQEFAPGMDPRNIDWKRSARMRGLIVRETRAERNHQIMLCLDSGRLMAEDLAGLSKLDRAINAALAMCWAAGLAGDLAGLYSFDSRPRLFAPPLPGRTAFPRLQTLCADLQYETRETNHTLGLAHLSGLLKRRSLVIIFSDFVDSITAELMIETIGVLARRHFVMYVALRDPALDALVEPATISSSSIARSVAARQIRHERHTVLDTLSRLGVLCLDSTPDRLTSDLIARYIDIKSRELI